MWKRYGKRIPMWVTVVLILSMVGCGGENDQGIHETDTPEVVAVEVDTEDNGENMTDNNEGMPGPEKAVESAAGPSVPDRPSMVRVEGGEFRLDYVQIEPRPVWVDEFEIAVYKVTIGEWREFLRQVPEVLAWNPPQWSSWDEAHVSRLGDDQYTTENLPEDWPVMSIRWYDALWYANWLSERHGYEPVYEFDAEEIREYLFRLAEDFDRHKFDPGPQVVWRKEADGYRLPTEAEWQYAAIGGQANDPLWEREDIDEYAWLGDPSNPDSTLATPRPVGLKKPNALGLYDVVGLAMEWNWNYFNETYYDEMPYRNPTGPDEPFWTDFEQQLDGNNMRVAPGCNFWMRRRYCVQRWHGIGGAWGGPTVGLRLARGPVLDPDGER